MPAILMSIDPFQPRSTIESSVLERNEQSLLESRYDDELDMLSENLCHPLGVKPSGNALTSAKDVHDSMGSFRRLPDVMILMIMEFLDQRSLSQLASTCRGCFAYSTYDQLWRDLAINQPEKQFRWRGSWRASLRGLESPKLPNVDCQDLCSDALYRPFLCSQISLSHFVSNIPKVNQIPKLKNLSCKDFSEKWTEKPFILTEPIKRWQVYRAWDQDQLLKDYGDIVFRAEAVDWPLTTYVAYMNQNVDESPLYLFDCRFMEKMKLEFGYEASYQPPECFDEDLFQVFGKERPDHRWLIIGPEKSGSTFHKDPNATSAWNAVIRGSKYWIMFPSSIPPPGVFVSEDQSEVTSPLSIAEWLLTFHREARRKEGCLEGICAAGEVLHVPSGWWHLVVNLEPAIAITQNFLPRGHLRSALNFLKQKADQVSGFRDNVQDPYGLFTNRLEEKYPSLIATIPLSGFRKRKWDEVVGDDSERQKVNGGFAFGFSNEDLLEDD